MTTLITLQTTPSPTDYVALTFLSLLGATFLSRGLLWDQPDPYKHLLYERPQLTAGNLSKKTEQTRNIAKRLEETGSSVVVFWGSQSGTAESFAHRLAREITLRFGRGALPADLSDYESSSISEIPRDKLLLFILSTYGEGDPPDNTVEFWGWLGGAGRENKPGVLDGLRYCAFGLGNSSYKFYNRVVDRVVEGLRLCGASCLLPVAKADDALGSTQEDFISWKETLFTFFREGLGFTQSELVYQPSLSIALDESVEPAALHRGPRSPSVSIPISGMRELFGPTSDRHCLHIDLDISSIPDLVYKTGDHLAVSPSNPDEEVDLLLRMLGRASEANTPVKISAIENADFEDAAKKVPSPTTLLVLFRHYLEITAPLPRDILATLAPFAPSAEAKTFLTTLANDKEAYADFRRKNHLTLARVLASVSDQPWNTLPLSYLIETLPPLQPRFYSISSSSVVSPRKISLTVLVLSTPLQGNKAVSIPGLTSTYLLSLSGLPTKSILPKYTKDLPSNQFKDKDENEKRNEINALLRRSPFKLPRTSTTPLVLIAAGTGLAPFRAFLSERRQLLKIGREVGPILLFFGCRSPHEDFIYSDEIAEMEGVFGELLTVVTAFSRFGDTSERKYVQDRVGDMEEEVREMMIERKGNLYICGRAAMAREVEKKVKGFLAKGQGGQSEEEAEEWIRGLKRRSKWLEDVWG